MKKGDKYHGSCDLKLKPIKTRDGATIKSWWCKEHKVNCGIGGWEWGWYGGENSQVRTYPANRGKSEEDCKKLLEKMNAD